MNIEERIALLEAENAKLSGKLHPTPAHNKPRSIGFLGLVEDKPGFKAFCRRTFNAKAPTMAEILEKAKKSTNAKIRAAMKPKGIWSILKDGPYTTGRMVGVRYEKTEWNDDTHAYDKTGEYEFNGPFEEKAKLVQVSKGNKWEWTSELDYEADAVIKVYPQNVPEFGKDPVYEPDEDQETPSDTPDLEQSQPKTGTSGNLEACPPTRRRRAIIADWVGLYRDSGMAPGLSELKKAVRDFERGEAA